MAEAGSSIYNMTDIYKKRLHTPIDNNGNIYYITREGAQGLNAEEMRILKNNNWLKDKSTNCNSPTNIRRIWFTAKNIAVEYYASPKRDNVPQVLVDVKTLGGVDFRNHAKSLAMLLSLPDYQRKQAVKAGTMKDISIVGSPFRAKGQYVFNNLEEIYFDWTALMSKDCANLYEPFLGQDFRRIVLETYINNRRLGQVPHCSDIVLTLFLGNNEGRVAGTYKRLRKIVMISHLQDILDHCMANGGFSQHVDTFSLHNVVEQSTSWMDRDDIKSLINATQSDVWAYEISGTSNKYTKLEDDFILKPSIYEFDHEVLIGTGQNKGKIVKYIEAVKKSKEDNGLDARIAQEEAEKQAKEAERQARMAEIQEQDKILEATGPAAGSIYEFLEQIKSSTNSENIAKRALAVAVVTGNDYDFGLALDGMPSKVKQTYIEEIKRVRNLIKG